MGSVGSLYLVILIMLLVIGLGSIGLRLIEYLIDFNMSSRKAKNNLNIKK